MSEIKTFTIDVLERAGKTFVQSAGAVLGVEFVAAGLDHNIFDLGSWEKVGAAAATAGVAGVVSLITSIASGLKTGTASASVQVAESSVVLTPGKHESSNTDDTTPHV